MKNIPFEHVELTGGYLYGKQELNRKTTIHAVYDRFLETGRFAAFDFNYKEGDAQKPHWFWDSDVAKWLEAAACIIRKHPSPALERIIDETVEKIKAHQAQDGYFNIYHTMVEPEMRWRERQRHELYCAGHLMEAAVAYAEATGKTDLLACMEKYADHICKVFVEDKSAGFFTPGHEEIELALVKMYRHTGKRKYLDLAAHFINERGKHPEDDMDNYTQSHRPVREQTEAAGHAVRALYLYTGMAYLAAETGEDTLIAACRTLFEDVTTRQMYVTGATGSTYRGEAFTTAFDLPNDSAYAETCASIALMLFGNAMLALENDAKYADAVERALYNGVLSGISQDGRSFFYENPLEINLAARFQAPFAKRHLPITERVACFECSCCPPNVTRLLATLGNYVYGVERDTLFVNQFISSTLDFEGISCAQKTNYPHNGCIKLQVSGAERVAVRIPAWCESFTLNKPYVMQNGYAVMENDGLEEIILGLDVFPRLVWADPRVLCNVGKACVMRGPVLYCAEGVDNGAHLHSLLLPAAPAFEEATQSAFELPTLKLPCLRRAPFEQGNLYQNHPPVCENTTLTLIPYNAFANRGESDMLVWFHVQA